MQEEILQKLDLIEKEKGVRILLAVESGSRAWGFASPDSDWDVRFVYVRDFEHYLSIDVENKRDVIEYGDEGTGLDIVGWDLRKSLKLFAKSNPGIVEWLHSPIVYREGLEELREMLPDFYSPLSGYWHYKSMARANKRNYLDREGEIKLKKYLYVFRGLLSARWIGTNSTPPPLEFRELLPMLEEGEVSKRLNELLECKVRGEELMVGEKVEIFNEFIDRELESEEFKPCCEKRLEVDYARLNQLFRSLVGG